ncbi:MAG: hypothetical protein SFW65_05855 [Alphaproteobacteria bacterium]|nr:hypothetical protein [Alphaproteobacteria bacterium]
MLQRTAPLRRPDNYAELNVPPPVKGLVVYVEDMGGYDKVVFTTDAQPKTHFVVYAPHLNERHKSNIHKGNGLILRRASSHHAFGVASIRAFLETGVNKNLPRSKWQTVRLGMTPFYLSPKDIGTQVIAGKVDEMVQWEKGWHNMVVENGRGLSHLAVPEGDLVRDAWHAQEFRDAPTLRVKNRDRIVAFPEMDVAFFYERNGGFRGASPVKPSRFPAPF